MPAPRHTQEEAAGWTGSECGSSPSARAAATSPFDVGGAGQRPEATATPNVHSDLARYFVITSNTKENVVKSVRHSLWATQRKNEQRLDDAFRTAPVVILVFSVNRSEAFQGYARMRSPVGRPRSRSADPFNGFGRLFDVEWLRLHDLGYHEVESLRNPLNSDRPVQFSRDGQELANEVGRRLCGLIDRHIDDPGSFAPWPPSHGGGVRQPHLQPLGQPVAQPGSATVHLSGPLLPPPYSAAMPTAHSRARASSSSTAGSEGRRHRKRRKKERKYRHPPHPVLAEFDEQLEFFLSLDYEDYVEWWRRFGGSSPGPTPPPGAAPTPSLPPPMAPMPGAPLLHPQMAVAGGHVPMLPPPATAPPMHGLAMPPWQPFTHHMVPPHMAPPHIPPPHMVPLHAGRA